MSSFRQIAANRHNALKSTGPITAEGKERSRGNAIRHGLTAETVIATLEDQEDYQAFEAAVIADYDAETTVERELVLRLASALWRLRRATGMETALFELAVEGPQGPKHRSSGVALDPSRDHQGHNQPLLRAVLAPSVAELTEPSTDTKTNTRRMLPAPDGAANLRLRPPQPLRAHAVAASAADRVHTGIVAATHASAEPI